MDKKSIKNKVLKPILNAGFQAYFVGGCVRDALLGKQINDFDIATNATPENLQKIFTWFILKESVAHGVTIPIIDNEPVEIATFRKESTYSDGRHPDGVVFTDSMKEDALRRDFTINALYENIDGNIFDPTNQGLEDLKNQVLRFIGNTEERINEDRLRALRYCRFIAQLDFVPKDFFHVERDFFNDISYERIGAELKKLFGSDRPVKEVLAAIKTGVFNTFAIDLLDIIDKMSNEGQRPDFHFGDVLKHTFAVMENLRQFDHDWRDMMAAFFHDVGKSIVGKINGPRRVGETFNSHAQHEIYSAKFFESWVKQRPGMMCNSDINIIKSMILNHTAVGNLGERKDTFKIYKVVSNPFFDRTVKLEIADQRAHVCIKHKIDEVLDKPQIKEIISRVGEPRKVTGKDLIGAGLKPDSLFGKRLEAAFKAQIKHPDFDKQKLLEVALSVK